MSNIDQDINDIEEILKNLILCEVSSTVLCDPNVKWFSQTYGELIRERNYAIIADSLYDIAVIRDKQFKVDK